MNRFHLPIAFVSLLSFPACSIPSEAVASVTSAEYETGERASQAGSMTDTPTAVRFAESAHVSALPIPPIDAEAPAKFETATFALG